MPSKRSSIFAAERRGGDADDNGDTGHEQAVLDHRRALFVASDGRRSPFWTLVKSFVI